MAMLQPPPQADPHQGDCQTVLPTRFKFSLSACVWLSAGSLMHQGYNSTEELTPALVRCPRGHTPALITGQVSRYQKPSVWFPVSYFPGEQPVLSLGHSAACCLEDYGSGDQSRAWEAASVTSSAGKDSDHRGRRQGRTSTEQVGHPLRRSGFTAQRHEALGSNPDSATCYLAWGQVRL